MVETHQRSLSLTNVRSLLLNSNIMFSFRVISLAVAGAMLLVGQAQAAALIATDPG